jgi:membrane protein DedA with SNARE-associated domain
MKRACRFFIVNVLRGGILIAELETQIISALQSIFDQFGWFGMAGLLAFENATGIIPSEIILGLAGWMLLAAHDAPPAWVLVGGLYAALGSVTGSSVTYWLVRLGGRPVLDRIAGWIRLDARHILHAEALFKRWGAGLILFGRLVPGIRTLITLPAGMARMPYPQFLLFTFIGAYLWCTSLIGLGYIVGHEWHLISELVGRFTPWAIAGFIALGGVGLTVRWLIQRRMRLQPVYLKTYENE